MELIMKTGFAITFIVGLASVAIFWWLPQKWEACSNQFDNIILRLACMD